MFVKPMWHKLHVRRTELPSLLTFLLYQSFHRSQHLLRYPLCFQSLPQQLNHLKHSAFTNQRGKDFQMDWFPDGWFKYHQDRQYISSSVLWNVRVDPKDADVAPQSRNMKCAKLCFSFWPHWKLFHFWCCWLTSSFNGVTTPLPCPVSTGSV